MKRPLYPVASVISGPVAPNPQAPAHEKSFTDLLASRDELRAQNNALAATNIQLEEGLERQRATADALQNVLFSTNVATLFLDTKLNIRFFTPATRMLFNLRPGDVGRPLADLAPLSSDQLLLPDARTVLAGEPMVEREIEAKAGTWFNRRILPYKTSTDQVDGVVIAFSEITERHRFNDALAEAERTAQRATDAKTRFLAVASHDLRQPLQTMVILTDLLARVATGPRAANLVERLGATLASMTRMLDVLLDINQIEAGAILPEKTLFRISDIFDRLLTEFSYTARAKNLELRLVQSSLEVYSDPVLLEQMLRNLVSNALKYTHDGKVMIGCRRRGSGIVAEVWDTGIGIEESEILAIFEEYHQVNNPARERSLGLGLGLNIVQRLGAMLEHRIGAVSIPGRGSVFSVEIENPARNLPPQPVLLSARPPKRAAIAPDKARILIVEDDPELRDLLDLLLREQGHETLSAEDGPSALALVAAGAIRPDLVLTDFNLPGGLDGLALAEELRRSEHRELPAIVLTGDISTLAMRRISQQDVLHLAKPVTVDRLNRALSDLLGPLSEAAVSPAPIADGTAYPIAATAEATIFLVDDDEQLRLSLRELLQEAGHEVHDYPSCEAFLADYVSGTAGCLLIDAYLPGMSGIELLQHLEAQREPLASIMITGHSDVTIAVAAMKSGAADFVEKPISGPDLLARIDAALARGNDRGSQSAEQEQQRARLATLTPRQQQVLDCVLAGMASKVIAYELGISQRTIESHRAAIMERLGAKSVPALVRFVLGAGQSGARQQ
jgi:two-component system CheB/CheR fusion protein